MNTYNELALKLLFMNKKTCLLYSLKEKIMNSLQPLTFLQQWSWRVLFSKMQSCVKVVHVYLIKHYAIKAYGLNDAKWLGCEVPTSVKVSKTCIYISKTVFKTDDSLDYVASKRSTEFQLTSWHYSQETRTLHE